MPRYVLEYSHEEFQRMVPYGCIVESWGKVCGHGASGSKRRKYRAAFDEVERKVIVRWHAKFRSWCLVSGPPEIVLVHSAQTVLLLGRAAHFFATA